jgi:hypothetical protein
MISVQPIELEGNGVRLEPLRPQHERELAAAAADGALWELWFTVVPAPAETKTYIETALARQREGTMLPWAVRNLATGAIVGSTRYHDIVANIDRRITRGMRRAGSAATSTRAASCCCSRMPSSSSAARSSAFAPTSSTSPRSARSKPSARGRMASSGISERAATALRATS